MKKHLQELFPKMRNYWRRVMESTHNKISRGAANISKVITSAHGDQWRRNKTDKK